MKIGLVPVNVGGPNVARDMVELAHYAEAAGLESVWTFEHVMVPIDYQSRYPYHRSGKMPITNDTWFVDPLISLAHIAGATTTLRLGTGVNILPQTNPLLFAKQAASIDQLSNGRLLLGLGIGWLEEEFEAMGTPFARRGARFRDYIEAIKKVWSGDVVEHHSDFLDWSGFVSHPTPQQQPHPPLLIGGTSDPAMRRVVDLGDGWYAPSSNIGEFKDQLSRLKAAAELRGRELGGIELTTTWLIGLEPDKMNEYADLGVARLIVPLLSTGADGWKAGIDRIAQALD